MVISWDNFIKGKISFSKPVSATIGVFDGVHLGHRKLISSILTKNNSLSAVITFNVNPRIIFKDPSYPGNISTLDQKIQILHDLEVDEVIVIDFSPDFSRLIGEEFLRLLVKSCNLKYLVLGENFKFGYGGKTTPEDAKNLLYKESVEVDICPMAYHDNIIVSSTRIRKALLEGRIKDANTMLNRVFSLDIANIPLIFRKGTIIIDKKKIHQVLPPQGHYDVSLTEAAGAYTDTGCVIDGSHISVNTEDEGVRKYTAINFNSDIL